MRIGDRVPEVPPWSQIGQICRYQVGASRTVLLLLESPHVDEYGRGAESGRMWPIAPAQGTTERQIEDHLVDVLSRGGVPRELCDGARVILANPVPYQASLGSIVKIPSRVPANRRREIRGRVRDSVWETLWNIEVVRRDFEDRLRRYAPIVTHKRVHEDSKQARRGVRRRTLPEFEAV